MDLFSARGLSRDSLRSRGRAILLTASLILVAIVAVAFALTAVRMQAAVTDYSRGESAWSRSQVSATLYLLVFTETGNRASLEEARSYLNVPVGDMEARLAMERRPFDRDAAIAGFLQGRNHPDDVDRMIWMFRYFSNAPYFREAVEVWRQSDPHIVRLQELGEEAERWWAGQDDARPISEIRADLVASNQELGALADAFRQRMAEAARVLSRLLGILSIAGLVVLGILATMLGGRLVRTITESARGFRAIFEQTAVGIAQVGPDGEVVDANDALCSTLGYPRSQLVGMKYAELVPDEEQPLERKAGRRSTDRDGRGRTVERQVVTARGESFWARVTASRLRFGEVERPHSVVVIEDISEARELTERLQHQATHDELTGLMNRRAFGESIERHIRAARESGTHHGLCFIDLDQFKVVNDTVGHAAGDHLLRQIALRLRESLRESDLIARLGGDEFAVIFEDCSIGESQELAERLLAALEEYEFTWESHRFQMSCSVGLTPITPETPGADTVLRAADAGCLLAKDGGRNSVYIVREGDQALV